jgi:hypothetical protein
MKSKRRSAISMRNLGILCALVLGIVWPASASADPDQHGPSTGHLPPTSENVELVGKLRVTDAGPAGTADVAAFGNYAYLAWRNTGPCEPGRVNIVDISNPANPVEVGRITFPPQSFPGEGTQVVRLNTPAFKGDVLVTNNENCTPPAPGTPAPTRVGGFSLYNVTNPLAPATLVEGAGDRTSLTGAPLPRANQYHSAFAWQQGRNAYLIGVDNAEAGIDDVDIFDISNPSNPVFIAEVGLPDWPAAQQPLANGSQANHHDLVVRKVSGHWLAAISYWDAGLVILNVDNPAFPVFVNDSDYPEPDSISGFSPAEGNQHQAEWNRNGKYIVGTDEDFAPFRTKFQITSGPNTGFYQAGEFSFTPRLATRYPAGLNGRTIWGGSGCTSDTDGNGISDREEVPPASTIPADPGHVKVVVFSRGGPTAPSCFFSDKIRTGELKGYDAVIVGQSHVGAGLGTRPESFTCGAQGSPIAGTAPSICIGHRAMHLLFNDTPEYTPAESNSEAPMEFWPGKDLPAIGTIGERIRVETAFDGWSGVRLMDAKTLEEIDAYWVSESMNPAFASGFGTLSVHEVATSRDDANLAYLSYYHAGMRVIRFGDNGITEVGRFIDTGGSNFWGVEAHRLPGDETEKEYFLGSDRDIGLYIFEYTGP